MSFRPRRRTGRSGRRPTIATEAEESIRAGRALKYRAARTADAAERRALFAAAAREYRAASGPGERASTYALINAASLHLLAGEREQAAEKGGEVLALLESGRHAPDTGYWLAATRAEAELVMGDTAAARTSLTRAMATAPRAWEDHAITLRQFRLLLRETGQADAWLQGFTPPPVLTFGGTMGIGGADEAAHARIAEAVAQIAPCEGYGALAAGTDIIVAEALLERGGELHAILPTDPARFRESSVAAVEESWGTRFDACLERAASLAVVAPGAPLDAPTSGLALRIAMGRALGRAKELETRAIGLRGLASGSGTPEIADAWAAWQANGNGYEAVAVERSASFAGFPAAGETRLRTVLAVGETTSAFPDVAEALGAARRHQEAPIGLDIQVGDEPRAELAIAAAKAASEPGLWASADALALALLAEPEIEAELAGAVRHARGMSDIYRVYLP